MRAGAEREREVVRKGSNFGNSFPISVCGDRNPYLPSNFNSTIDMAITIPIPRFRRLGEETKRFRRLEEETNTAAYQISDDDVRPNTITSSRERLLCCEDMILQILHRLPTKSLCRFICVSKRWNDLISSPSQSDSCRSVRWRCPPSLHGFFFQNREKYYMAPPRFVYTCPEVHESNAISDTSLGFINGSGNAEPVFIVGSFRGFLLCSNSVEYQMRFHICNPITKQNLPLPSPSNCYRLAVTGFCYSTLGAFFIIRFEVPQTFIEHLKIDVLSTRTGSWKVFNLRAKTPFSLLSCSRKPGIVVDGAFYWSNSTRLIVCDMLTKCCWEMALPVTPNPSGEPSSCLGGSGSRLHYGFTDGVKLEIWVMVKNGDGSCSWLLKHTVFLKTLGEMHPKLFGPLVKDKYSVVLRGFDPNNANTIFFTIAYGIVAYNTESKKLDVHNMIGLPANSIWKMQEFNFFPFQWYEWQRSMYMGTMLSGYGNSF